MSLPMRLALIAGMLAIMLLGYAVRGSFEVEASVDSVRRFIGTAGWWAPVLFVGLFGVRTLLLLPGPILLTAGGIGFGFTGGMVLGAMGLTFSAMLKFAVCVIAGREWLAARLPSGVRARLDSVNRRTGVGALALVSAYPLGPADMLQTAAILGGIRLLPLVAGVGSGSLVRAGSFSYFGEAVADGRGLLLGAVLLLTLAAVPLVVSRLRRARRDRR
ncbi:MAG: hypothetical protein ACRERC_23400 [Candidatus Binatia bacterium]